MLLHEEGIIIAIIDTCHGCFVATILIALYQLAQLSKASLVAAGLGLMGLLDSCATPRLATNRLDDNHVVTLCVYTLFMSLKVYLVVWCRRLGPLGRRFIHTACMLGRSICIYYLG